MDLTHQEYIHKRNIIGYLLLLILVIGEFAFFILFSIYPDEIKQNTIGLTIFMIMMVVALIKFAVWNKGVEDELNISKTDSEEATR